MSIFDGNWKTFLARATVLSTMLGVVVFGAVKLAVADPGGPTTPQLTFAGVLRDPSGELPRVARSATLTFTFTKPGAAPCSVDVRDVPIAAGGAFTAGVSIASCPTYFDGSNVTYTVAEGGAMLTPDGGVAITPVPYARSADQVGVNNDCPAGYQRATDPAFADPMRLCQRKLVDGTVYDEVVRVGTGASAFWIDRYEACVNTRTDDTGSRRFASDSDFPTTFPRDGQATVPLYALSRSGTTLSRWITWFQANEACRASGKRLPTGDEWLAAARGTPDDASRCVTMAVGPARPGDHPGCASNWGAQDMIGNLWEWTGEWYAGAGNGLSADFSGVQLVDGGVRPTFSTARVHMGVQNWPEVGSDGTWNINGFVNRSNGTSVVGLPAAALRGGGWGEGPQAGVHALDLEDGPSAYSEQVGFRCVIPR